MLYDDKPKLDLTKLTKEEISIYTKGFILACIQMRELLSETKYELLGKLMDEETKNKWGVARTINSLDILEAQIKRKEVMLGESSSEQGPRNPGIYEVSS